MSGAIQEEHLPPAPVAPAIDYIGSVSEFHAGDKGLSDQLIAEIYTRKYQDTTAMADPKNGETILFVHMDGRYVGDLATKIVHDRVIQILENIQLVCNGAIEEILADYPGFGPDDLPPNAKAAYKMAASTKKWAITCKNEQKLTSILKAVGKSVSNEPLRFDSSDDVICLPNGCLKIYRGDFLNVIPEYNVVINPENGLVTTGARRVTYYDMPCMAALSTRVYGVKYVEDAECPEWEEFVREAVSFNVDGTRRKDVENVEAEYRFIQDYAGYSMLRGNPDQAVMMWIGRGGSGRSTIAEVLAGVMGDGVTGGYAQHGRKELIISNLNGRIKSDKGMSVTKHFVYIDEFNEYDIIDGAELKSLTDKSLMIEVKHVNPVERRNNMKLLLISNYDTKIDGYDNSIERRLYILHFYRRVQTDKQVPYLSAKLLGEEGPGILNWMIAGLEHYLEKGNLRKLAPKSALDQTLEHIHMQDRIRGYIQNHLAKNPVAKVSLREAYYDMKMFYNNLEEEPPAKTIQKFASLLRSRDFDVRPGMGGRIYIYGMDRIPYTDGKEKETEQGQLGDGSKPLDLKKLDQEIKAACKTPRELKDIFAALPGYDENTVERRVKYLEDAAGELTLLNGKYEKA